MFWIATGASQFANSLLSRGWGADLVAVCFSAYILEPQTRAYLIAFWLSSAVCLSFDWGDKQNRRAKPQLQLPQFKKAS